MTPQADRYPALLRNLHAFAMGRLRAGHGMAALQQLGAALPALMDAYQIGYFPETVADAVSQDDRELLGERLLGHRFVVPLQDQQGMIRDLLLVDPDHPDCWTQLLGESGGLLGARLLRTLREGEIRLVERFPDLVASFQHGATATLWLPEPYDHTDLAEWGVAIAEDGGDEVELLAEESDEDVILCAAGEVRFAIESRDDDLTQRLVVVRCGGQAHRDRLDLAVPAQCQRYVGSAAQRLRQDREAMAGWLAEAWHLVQQHEASRDELPVVVVEDDAQAEALHALRDPDLLTHIAEDLTTLGWVGEDAAKGLLYLAAVSRLLPEPLWSVYRATAGAAPWRSLGLVASLVPPEDCLVFHRLTERLLRDQDRRALRHKLLLVDRAETIRPEGALALRVLHERGSIGWRSITAQADAPSLSPLLADVQGPVAVLAAAAGDLDRRCRDCFVQVTVDESPEQTQAVLAAQRAHHGRAPVSAAAAEGLMRRHHAMQRCLEQRPVVIPFADRIHFPMTSVRHRDEQAAFLTLIEASALLHQHQRDRDEDEAILADEVDFTHARRLAGHLLGATGAGLSRQGRLLLQRLFAAGREQFAMRDLAGLLPDWTRYAYRAAIGELTDLGYLESVSGGGRGKARCYQLTGEGREEQGIRLLPVGVSPVATSVGELATVGDGGSPTVTPWEEAG